MKINGKPVVDATRKMVLHITQRDTVKGATKDPGACAAARAAKRGIPNCISARVHLGRVYIEQRDKWLRLMTGGPLRSEVIAFDRGGKFMPGEYEILPPSPAQRLDYQRSKSDPRTNKPSGTKTPRRLHVTKGVRQRGANR